MSKITNNGFNHPIHLLKNISNKLFNELENIILKADGRPGGAGRFTHYKIIFNSDDEREVATTFNARQMPNIKVA